MAGSGGDWTIDADGCISVGEPADGITYHPTLNIILILTKEPAIKVLDINSGSLLHKSTLSAVPKSVVKCAYLPNQDKILITDGHAVGLRRDHGGVLLLDTILQTSVNKTNDMVKIELPLSEAVQLLKCLQSTDLPVADNVADLIKFLEKEIAKCQFLSKNKHKSVKWSTVCLEFPHSYLKCVSSSLVQELKRLNKFVPALAIASAISERLNTLLTEAQTETVSSTVDRSLMFSEAARRETFGKWPHMNYKWALPDQMAQAGFYHQPNSTGDDRAMCFTCNVCLVCWEPTDEPWSEHERHSPSCPFVKGEYTQNVPLAVTYATNPAVLLGGRQTEMFHIAPSSHSELIATYSSNGTIVVWDITRQLKKEVNFCISSGDDGLSREKRPLTKSTREGSHEEKSDSDSELSDLSQRCNLSSNLETYVNEDMDPSENNLRDVFSSILLPKPIVLTSVCVLGPSKSTSSIEEGVNSIRPCIVAGVSLKQDSHCFGGSSLGRTADVENPPLVQVLNDVNIASNREKSLNIMHLEEDNDSSSVPCLLIYDITRQSVKSVCEKRPVISSVMSKKVSSSNGTQQKTNTSYGNFSGLLYDICDDALDPMCSLNIVDVGPLESFANSGDLKFGGPSSSSDLQNSDVALIPSSTSFIEQQTNHIEVRDKFHATGLITQYIELPKCFQTKLFYINSITPTNDGKYIMVTVSHQTCNSCENEVSNPSPKDSLSTHNFNNLSTTRSENILGSNMTKNKTQVPEDCFGGCLLYKLNFNTECITLDEEPFLTRIESSKSSCVKFLQLLPQELTDSDYSVSNSTSTGPSGYFVTVTFGNQIRLHSLSSFEILAETSVLPEEVVSVIYCTSIEKLCACTVQGSLLFFNLIHTQTAFSDTDDVIESLLQPDHILDEGLLDSGILKEPIEHDGGISELLIHQPLTSEVLLTMHELVQFENLTPQFAANMPPCWTEIQQEQKQRRHPQHLQQQGEAMQHTRSWRLQNDSNTWDEHLFEITLPKLCCIGHIDFKFNLHPMCNNLPNVQITLLKQNTSGIGKINCKRYNDNVDESIDFNAFATNDTPDVGSTLNGIRYMNPVTSKSFLESHNAEIICGPLELSSSVDLSNQSGVVTLTSPELFNFSSRSFLIHLKALLNERDQNHKQDVSSSKSVPSTSKSSLSRPFVVKIKNKCCGVPSLQSMLEYFAPPGSAVDRLAATAPNKKITNLKGCDWFHEISLTIRKTKGTCVHRERFQRAAMLRCTSFHEKLIDVICTSDSNRSASPENNQHMALDILIWIAAIQMHKRITGAQNNLVFFTIQSKLESLIESCFIKGTRTVAHKCSKLIVICLEHAKSLKNPEAAPIFNFTLFQGLLEWLPKIPECHSAGALRWFFLLLNRVKCLDLTSIGQKCVDLLITIAKQYNEQNNPLHSLLRSRFGLYGIPFEPELFDIEPSPCLKPQSTPISYASVVSTSNTATVGGNHSSDIFSPNEELDLRDLLTMNVHERLSSGRSLYSFPGNHLRGLLEVEPLHFTCHAASDGTKMEKIDTGTNSGIISNATLSGSMFDHIPSHLHGSNGFGSWTGSLSTLFTTLKKKQEVDITPLNINHGYDFYPKSLTGSGTIMVSTSSANSAFSYQGAKNATSSAAIPNSLHVEKIYAGTGESDQKGKSNGKTSDSKKDGFNPYASFFLSPWQQLLQSPPQQVLVIERMHSGARRFVVLDFGKNVLLTDLMIPACSDLVSLSIDIWKQAEEIDGQRLVVTTDIGYRSLVMSDLQPPPVCRFLKITTIGRYGMSTTRCRIPIGMFYGHTFILPWEHGRRIKEQATDNADQEDQENQIQPQLNALSSLLEDIHCRYSLACDKLFNFLMPLIPTEPYNSNQTHLYLQREKDKLSDEDQRIISAYQECLQLQLQLNLITHAMARLDRAQAQLEGLPVDEKIKLPEAGQSKEIKICTDKLRTLIECLLGVLLGLTYPTQSIPHLPSGLYSVFDQNICETLLRYLCVNGSRRMQLSCSILLVRMCGMQPWWGKFIAKMLVTLYSSEQSILFPQDRIFILLTYLGQKSLSNNPNSSVLQSVISLLEQLLKPLLNRERDFVRGILDLPLIGWVLLFLSVCLDNTNVTHQSLMDESDSKASVCRDKDAAVISNRWDFIHGEVAMLRNRSNNLKSSASRLYRRKLQKRLMHHKQQLEDLEQAKKNFLASTQAMTALHSQFGNKNSCPSAIKDLEAVVKHQEKLFQKNFKRHTAKHFKDIIQIRRNACGLTVKPGPLSSANSCADRDDGENEKDVLPPLSRNQCLPVVKGLTSLLLAMDFTCNVDMFLLACKVLARIATSTRPAINLCEVFSQDQLIKLIQLCVGNENQTVSSPWGGPWASHSIICLLQDILEGERLFPCSLSHEASPSEDDLITLTTETDDSLQEATSFPMGDEVDSVPLSGQAESPLKIKDLLGIIDSDDSESDDCNLDIFESNSVAKKFPFGPHKKSWTGIYNVIKNAKMAGKESKSPDLLSVSNPNTGHTVSTAVDARLEYGLEMNAELRLKVMMALEADVLSNAIVAPLQNLPDGALQECPVDEEEESKMKNNAYEDLSNNFQFDHVSSVEMLSICFNQIFSQLQVLQVNLESLLQLWLSVTEEASTDSSGIVNFEPATVPTISLNTSAIAGLLSALAWYPTVSLRTWCLAFQSLTILSNLKSGSAYPFGSEGQGPTLSNNPLHRNQGVEGGQEEINQGWMAFNIVNDPNLLPVLMKFLSGTRLDNTIGVINNNVGPTVTRALHNFLVRLQFRCDVVSPFSRLGLHLKDLMLKLVYSLITVGGAIQCCQGPLDAQCKFFESLLNLRFDGLDSNITVNVIVAAVTLIHNYIANSEKVFCRSSTETGVNASSCFGGLFASVLRGENQSSTASCGNRDTLICNLLKLVTSLVQIPFNGLTVRSGGNSNRSNIHSNAANLFASTSAEMNFFAEESLTDNSKIEQSTLGSCLLSGNGETDEHKTAAVTSFSTNHGQQHCHHTNLGVTNTIFIADSVLQHDLTMLRLLMSLANCSGSTMAMLLGVNGLNSVPPMDTNEQFVLGEPISVGDSIFQLLCTLNSKASSVKLILQALFSYISNNSSEQSAFSGLPIVPRLSEPLLWFILRVLDCETALSEFLQMGGMHILCKNLVYSNQQLINSYPSFISTIMQHLNNGYINQTTKRQGSDLDTVDGLLNFAPLGTITSGNPTAQPAEILIQAAPPHRRARTPAWSYHFYPDESWVDLTISLPCAILLKEIQIQPHLTSLATCPSAVSVEICRDSASGATPLCPPQPTNGLTFIRLQLAQPEIAMSVTLRLHRPRDSSNIGLSQVLLLGSTTFGEAAAKSRASSMPSEDSVSRSSLGWLRIIHHCLTLPVGFSIQQRVCDAAVSIPHFLQACCTLLLTPNLGVYMAHIEHVLLQLGLHSTEVGLTEIHTLLHNTGWTHTQDSLQVPITSSALDSVVEIIYQLCTTDDSSTKIRLEAVLTWLKEVADKALQENAIEKSSLRHDKKDVNKSLTNPPIAYIHCVASILWTLHETSVSFDLSSLLKMDLIQLLLQWSMVLPVKSALKRAVDQILCSVCHIQPETFTYVLECMDVLTVTAPVAGASNMPTSTAKLHRAMTDDYKEVEVEHPHVQKVFRVNLNESQLVSLAVICQSGTAVHHLLKSGLPSALIHKILDFCTAGNKETFVSSSTNSAEKSRLLNPSASFSDLQEGGTNQVNYSSPNIKVCSGLSESNSLSQSSRSADTSFWFDNELRNEGTLTDADKANYPIWHNNIHITGYNDPVTPEFVASALNFFTELCNENVMQNWLGGAEGSSFWLPLLHILCSSDSHYVPQSIAGKDTKKLNLSNHQRSILEMATLRFLSHCCWTHQANQQLLSQVLCDVIRHQGNHHLGAGLIHVISGFTRRLLLQLLLENEKILVFIRSQQTLPKSNLGTPSSLPQHPRFGCGHNFRLLYLNLQMTCSDIIKNISGIIRIQPTVENKEEKEVNRKDMAEIGLELVDHLSMAAGVTAKDKRQRDSKTNANERPSSSKNVGNMESTLPSNSLVLPTFVLTHEFFPGQSLPGNMSLCQLLAIIKKKNPNVTHITLNLVQVRKSRESKDTSGQKTSISDMLLAECSPLPTTLQVFASMGGLALLAQHLPLLYPEITRLSNPVIRPLNAERMPNDLGNLLDSDWVKVESTDDINDDFLELIPPGAASPQSSQSSQVPPPSIPPHSLAAFGLFLRLPGYAEVLLKEWKKAQCLLRLALGITDNGEGGDIFQSSVATSLPTLPFQVLQQLFDSTPLTTDDGMLLRRMTLEVGAIHLLLACLAVLSHQSEDINLPGLQNESKCQQLFLAAAKAGKSPQEAVGKSDNKSHLYWAKGTGFGTGSTDQSWDVEQAILRQRSEEEHVTCLLQVLSSYINPGGHVPLAFLVGEDCKDDNGTTLALLPPMFPELLSQSCLLPAISSYLRNDSVLDMARHVPLYRALLQLLRALAVSHQLVNLLLPIDGADASMSICCLLTKMKSCVDVYASKLKSNKGKSINKNSGKISSKTKEEEEENEGLAQLIPDIQETARIVQVATERLILEDEIDNKKSDKYADSSCASSMNSASLEERYINVMRQLQFDTFEMIVEDDDAIRFTISHHFESNLRAAGEHSHPSRARRLAQEAVTLSTSLPLSYSSSVFVRCDQDRLDLMKVLITGPEETPYANGCFEFDVYFPPDYPNSPMLINLETTGHHTVRFNPNLYNDGKVCLSVLNTWHGRPEEKWNPQTSSFLQVLVSIQSLILVQEPYFNEPGYERSRGTPSGTQSSREYDSNIRLATVKWAMLEQIRNPCPCFKEVINKHFWMKRSEIIKQLENWISEMDSQSSDRRTGRTIALNSVALKHHLAQLKEEFVKMKAPTGLEDMKEMFDIHTTQLTPPPVVGGNSSFNDSIAESSSQDSPDSNGTSVGPV